MLLEIRFSQRISVARSLELLRGYIVFLLIIRILLFCKMLAIVKFAHHSET